MKKVLLVFLGLVLLSQVFKFWQRGHEAALWHRHAPVKQHKSQPNNGAVMVASLNRSEVAARLKTIISRADAGETAGFGETSEVYEFAINAPPLTPFP